MEEIKLAIVEDDAVIRDDTTLRFIKSCKHVGRTGITVIELGVTNAT